MNILKGFRDLMAHREISEKMLVPLLIWLSGHESNIEMCQRINKRIYSNNANIYIYELSLCNSITHMIKYPKIVKTDTKLDFFYDDVCSFYGWTRIEFEKNLNVVDLESMKADIAKWYAYTNRQRTKLGLEAINYDKKKSSSNSMSIKRTSK